MEALEFGASASLVLEPRRDGRRPTELWAAFERVAGPALLLDDRRRVVEANPAALRAIAVPGLPLIGALLDDLVDPVERPALAEKWASFLRDRVAAGSAVLRAGEESVTRLRFHLCADVELGRHLMLALPTTIARSDDAPLALVDPAPTGRERQVLWLLADGATGSQIAHALGITEQTVQKHMANVKRKLGASTRAQMVTLAMRFGELTGLVSGERLVILQILRGEDGRFIDVCPRYICFDTLARHPEARKILDRPYGDTLPTLTGGPLMELIRRVAETGIEQEFTELEHTLPSRSVREVASGRIEPLANDRLALVVMARPA